MSARTGADVVSTACPYCMIMLDDAVRANAKETRSVMTSHSSSRNRSSPRRPRARGVPSTEAEHRPTAASAADELAAR